MSEEELVIQLAKIFIGVAVGAFALTILWHINHNLTTVIKQNGEIIEVLKK